MLNVCVGSDITGGVRRAPQTTSNANKDKGDKDKVKAVVNAQYNSPIAMYSMGNMNEVLVTKAVQMQEKVMR